ncbi:hypothetical protein [Neolewinella litorea]|uniref:Uncharacterized protein n=1 Tax=Neolewinella litorea TaxID=2562452 RepID=A0A4S4NE94_9BACT|nr:hypothetical protein [Neolewinella litorea]THH36418.1 hypothetical protein E4021_15145 [Neolewinella litorea]
MKYLRLTEVRDLQTLTLIKLSLGQQALRYRVLFEHSLYVGAYLLGHRGAVVEVLEDDYRAAVAVLAAEGIPADGMQEEEDFGPLHELELLTESLPLIGRLSVSLRFLALSLTLAAGVAYVIYALFLA